MVLPRQKQSIPTTLIISEFRTRGSNAGSDEFVEIFNPTQYPVNLRNWQIKRSSSGGSTYVWHAFPDAGLSLAPGAYYLVAGENYDDSVTEDTTHNTGSGIANDGGLALVDEFGSVVDKVGMSSGSAYLEGSTLPPLTTDTDQGYARVNVCEDTRNNAADFILVNPSQPQNAHSATTLCPVPTPTYTPTVTPDYYKSILINEVAWGGTLADGSAGQWIELYNSSGAEVTVDGWHLTAGDGNPDIVLSGVVPADGYYLLARRPDVFTPLTTALPTPLPTALPIDQPFPDSLDADGETLYLYAKQADGSFLLVDTANQEGGPWPSGRGFAPYASMERNGDLNETDLSWLTFAGTPDVYDRGGNLVNGSPGKRNWGIGQIPTLTPSTPPTPTFTATLTPTLTPTSTPSPTPTPSSTPSAFMSVIINEVAWMGTAHSGYDEWIELYNPGSAEIDITGWKITLDDANFIALSGKIGAGAYFVLENGSDATTYAENQTFTGSISNDGKKMKLLSGATLIDSANLDGGIWPAGNKDTYCSMERYRSNSKESSSTSENLLAWVTNSGYVRTAKDAAGNDICGSPGYRNWAYDVTITPTPLKSITPSRTPTRTRTPTPNKATPEAVVLNEFLPHPRQDWNEDGAVDVRDEFIEIINLGNTSLSLKGWKLDDQEGDSPAYTLPSVEIAPGGKLVLCGAETGLLLGNQGDTLRLFKSNGKIADAFTYGPVSRADTSWCRLPDGKEWLFGCVPSPLLPNALTSQENGETLEPLVCQNQSLPPALSLAECASPGLQLWNLSLWEAGETFFPFRLWLQGREVNIE